MGQFTTETSALDLVRDADGESPEKAWEFLRPLVNGWANKIKQAKSHKSPFTMISQQCMAFFAGSVSFMFQPKFQQMYMKQTISPRFKMCMNKGFELVASFGPSLYWQNPERQVRARKPFTVTPEVFGDVQDPFAQQQFQAIQQELQRTFSVNKTRASLMETYLNFTPGEQPNGGLSSHAEMAITEALVKGRGVLVTEPYESPLSGRVLTGSFFHTVDDLFIDPDSKDPSMGDAGWIALRYVHKYWEVEKEFGLERDSLKQYCQIESAQAQGETLDNVDARLHRADGGTCDLIEYYKVWSKSGIGSRMTTLNQGIKDEFDEVVGDYAYLVFSPNVPYLLNASSDFLMKATSPEVKERLRWPVEFWKDNRWPISVLDFYRNPDYQWPIAPLSPGLGELIFINIMTSCLCNRIYVSSRDFITVLRSAAKDFKDKLTSGDDLQLIEISDAHGKTLDEIVKVLQMPETNMDVWKIIEAVTHTFELRTGLSEFLQQGSQMGAAADRSAAATHAKQQNAGIRPEYMAGKVEDWMDECARQEKYAAYIYVKPQDVQPFLGNAGARLWGQLVNGMDEEVCIRGMEATVTSGSVRKPNHARDTENMQTLAPQLLPILSQFAQAKGDSHPFNAMLDAMGEAMDIDLTEMHIGEWPPEQPPVPPPDPNQLQQQQHDQMMAEHEAQLQQQQAAQQQQDAQQAASQAEQQHQQEMALRQQEIYAKQQEIEMKMQLEQAKLAAQQQKMQLDADAARQQMELAHAKSHLDLQMSAAQTAQQLEQQRLQGEQSSQIAKQQGDVKVQVMKKMAAAKPKPKTGAA